MLCKADLTTELVKEFTELQGIVGGLYAKVQELDPLLPQPTAEAIGDAIYDQYKPESMDDSVPRTVEGAVLAIADKADTIAGMFALGFEPTGSKDPFALRRAANGIVKIIAEHKLPLSLAKLFSDARAEYAGTEAEKRFDSKVDLRRRHQRLHPRAPGVLSARRPRLCLRRGECRSRRRKRRRSGRDRPRRSRQRRFAAPRISLRSPSPSSASRTSFARRAKRRKPSHGRSTPAALTDEAEKSLAHLRYLKSQQGSVDLREQKNYAAALTEISRLRQPVDLFFDKVMVMVDDEQVRANRLALLQTLLDEFSTIADFSEIVTETKSS